MRFRSLSAQRLSARTKRVLKKREKLTKPPIMIEFAGTPKSGKSSSIEVISHFFYRHGMNVYAPTEGVSKRTPPALKEDLLYYNTWAACYALMQMFEACYHTDNYELAIFDRGIFDFLA